MKKPANNTDKIQHWVSEYLQAKANGDKAKMKMYEAIIIKLGGKVPKN